MELKRRQLLTFTQEQDAQVWLASQVKRIEQQKIADCLRLAGRT